jgi:hypothetical protein
VPANISGLEEYKQEQEEEKQKCMREFEEVTKSRQALGAAQTPLLQELNEVKAQIAAYDEKCKVIVVRVSVVFVRLLFSALLALFAERHILVQDKAEKSGLERMQAHSDMQHWERKIAESSDLVKKARDEAESLEATFKVRSLVSLPCPCLS